MSLCLCVPADRAPPPEQGWGRALLQAHTTYVSVPPTHCHPNLKPLGFRHKPCLFRGGDQWRACGRGPSVESWWEPLACFEQSGVPLALSLAPAATGSSAKPQESHKLRQAPLLGFLWGFSSLPVASWRHLAMLPSFRSLRRSLSHVRSPVDARLVVSFGEMVGLSCLACPPTLSL